MPTMDLHMIRPAILLCLASFVTAIALAQETQPAPLSYDCHRTATPIRIDGKLDDPAWKKAPWTTDFVDIEGSAKPKPRFRTRAKMLWDDQVPLHRRRVAGAGCKGHAAPSMTPSSFTTTTSRSSSSHFRETESYYEFEMNALNTGWDLFLNKPYKQHGKADNSWEIPGLKTAVAVQGTLNHSNDNDHGWTIEIAYPWNAFNSRQDCEAAAGGNGMAHQLQPRRMEDRPNQRKTTGSGHRRESSTCTCPNTGDTCISAHKERISCLNRQNHIDLYFAGDVACASLLPASHLKGKLKETPWQTMFHR